MGMNDINVEEFESGYIGIRRVGDINKKSLSWAMGREVAKRVADLSGKVEYTKKYIIGSADGYNPAVLDFRRKIVNGVIAEHKEFIRFYDTKFRSISSKVDLARTGAKINILNLKLSLKKLSYY